jgi:chromosome segregation ATPase
MAKSDQHEKETQLDAMREELRQTIDQRDQLTEALAHYRGTERKKLREELRLCSARSVECSLGKRLLKKELELLKEQLKTIQTAKNLITQTPSSSQDPNLLAQLDAIKQKLEECQMNRDQCQATKTQYEYSAGLLFNKLDQQTMLLAQKQAVIADHADQIRVLRASLDSETQEKATLASEIERQTVRIAELEKQAAVGIGGANGKLVSEQRIAASLDTEKQDCEKKIQVLQNEVNELTSNLSKSQQQLVELTSAITEFDATFDEAVGNYQNNCTRLTDNVNKLMSKPGYKESLDKLIKLTTEQCDRVVSLLDDLKTAESAQKRKLQSGVLSAIASFDITYQLVEVIELVRSSADRQQKEQSEANTEKLRDLTNRLTELQTEKRGLEEQFQVLTSEYTIKIDTVEKQTGADLLACKTSIAEYKQGAIDSTNLVTQLKKTNEELSVRSGNLNNRVMILGGEKDKTNGDLNSLTAQMLKVEEEKRACDQQKRVLEAETDRISKELQISKGSIGRLDEKLKKQTQKLQSATVAFRQKAQDGDIKAEEFKQQKRLLKADTDRISKELQLSKGSIEHLDEKLKKQTQKLRRATDAVRKKAQDGDIQAEEFEQELEEKNADLKELQNEKVRMIIAKQDGDIQAEEFQQEIKEKNADLKELQNEKVRMIIAKLRMLPAKTTWSQAVNTRWVLLGQATIPTILDQFEEFSRVGQEFTTFEKILLISENEEVTESILAGFTGSLDLIKNTLPKTYLPNDIADNLKNMRLVYIRKGAQVKYDKDQNHMESLYLPSLLENELPQGHNVAGLVGKLSDGEERILLLVDQELVPAPPAK